MRLTEEQKKSRAQMKEIHKQYLKEHGKDRIKYHNVGDSNFNYRSFILFDNTEVEPGGWLIGRKWLTARFMNRIVDRWVSLSYATRADNLLKYNAVPEGVDIEQLKEIDRLYDLSAGCAQCGGCQWFAALDSDYGFCFNQDSPNEGRITFEHGGCIHHSFLQQLLAYDGFMDKNRSKGDSL